MEFLIFKPWVSFLVNFLDRVNHNLPGGEEHRLINEYRDIRDINGFIYRTKPHLFFTSKEERRGLEALQQMGISKNDSLAFAIKDKE